jgi:cation:H+ antiporter
MTLVWIGAQFAVCALIIARAGFMLTRSADRLADAYGWGRGWVGLALLATITSLPELASGISAVTLVQEPDLAVGNVLGACVVNLAFLVVVDVLQRSRPMYVDAGAVHLLSAGFGVVMLGFVSMNLLAGGGAPAILHVGVYSPALIGLYLLALRSVHAQERLTRLDAVTVERPSATPVDTRAEWRRCCVAGMLVVAAGSWLPQVADSLAQAAGISSSFVGTVFMALVTTLPEMAVTVAAVRLGALDMAISNLLGSNLFNVLILAVDDAFYTPGPLLRDADPVHAGTAATALVMTGLVIVGLVMRPRTLVLRLVSWVSVGLVAAYVINATVLLLRNP